MTLNNLKVATGICTGEKNVLTFRTCLEHEEIRKRLPQPEVTSNYSKGNVIFLRSAARASACSRTGASRAAMEIINTLAI